jgi:hypothetical protein
MDLEQKIPKNPKNFSCECCYYSTSSKKDFDKHNSTNKHKKREKSNQIEPENTQKSLPEHSCSNCNKIYYSKSGLWNHLKKCKPAVENTMVVSSPVLDNTAVFELVRQNQEFKELLIEQNKKLQELSIEPRINNNNCTNNTQNNHFNLQFFLNETCKDAMTADQFIKDIQISFNDLENIGTLGYVQGFTELIMKQLRTLDITKRPLHCTDIKRETIYIKEADTWNKDNQEKTKLKNVIETVAAKSRKNVTEWQHSHPEVRVLDSNDYEMNHKILRHTWGDGDTEKLQEKVIKNIAKEVHVEK